MSEMEPSVIVDVKDLVCTVTLNRPNKLNAFNDQMIKEFQAAIDRAAADKEIRVIILEGAGNNFSSGFDMSAALKGLSPSKDETLDYMKKFSKWIHSLRAMPQPVICKVKGAAVGGGANLALSGDFVIATHQARFSQKFIHIGLTLDCGGSYFLPRLVGLAKSRELAMLGEDIDGAIAASLGLIYKSCSDADIDKDVTALARKIAEKSPTAMSSIKDGLNRSFEMSMEQALAWETMSQAEMSQSIEHKAIVDFLRSVKAKK
jgi:2-(1,2-epoxy-1,2-dihydrophenyl)acetyl-CoA isomerase